MRQKDIRLAIVGLGYAGFPNSYAANDCSVSLPLFHGMTEAEKAFVIERVLKSYPQ